MPVYVSAGDIVDRWWDHPIETEKELRRLPVEVYARDANGVEFRTVGRNDCVRLDTGEVHVPALPAVLMAMTA
ncbi:Uncharacterised protein (plasmid) [Tsukamurella tyrosinosolvens]|uniref:Uncharacterized protein n=1 Tax=Tsukamurella tyrosinosolvens TaxID=57704 RepID=A0A1H4VU66_TSUTY|nr:hypothetical protein [Tsukamurella tyrosinosolvens]KXO90898.1 hypothetical protein AXK58_20920 [Tsukamurella tyrosinosolvens]SEC83824.1 hypothetical protein SAMN04489793_3319 [Tsukamurella tyrosinosolvens]VEH90332.1 Uncharacterised protein [Tsukamurella tyrosinosolvens]